jgi:hypothetical protein
LPEQSPLPFVANEETKQNVKNDSVMPEEQKLKCLNWLDQLLAGLVVIEEDGGYAPYKVANLFLSKCYNCKKVAVWVSGRLLFPATKAGVLPNPELPEEILHDFEEAREIVNASPRGAVALLASVSKSCAAILERRARTSMTT